MDIERHNHRQIEQLNQRGGRTLSIVDLIQAGTINVEMAADAMRAMAEGASLLTAARPGGAGKTAPMAAILGLLPPGVPIVTVDGSRVIHEGLKHPAGEPACYLAHEIGDGDWYGYIWGRDVVEFFSLIGGQRRIASCLHADTQEELTGVLCSPPLRVARERLGRTGPILFMHVAPGVACVSSPGGQLLGGRCPGAGHRMVFRWNATGRHPRADRRTARSGRAGPVSGLSSGPAGRGRNRDGGQLAQGSGVLRGWEVIRIGRDRNRADFAAARASGVKVLPD